MKPKVSLIQCKTYAEAAVFDAVKQTVDQVGGITAFVQSGQRVLLKVNLLRATEPDEATCTHPAVVKALVRLVQSADGLPIIGDSPGGPFTKGALRSVYKKTGMLTVAEETGAELNWDFGATQLSHPEGHLTKRLDIGTYITNADVIISLAKLKTHGFMQFTGATKILFGAIPGTVKLAYHAKFPERERFGDMLIDIVTLIRPALSLMDGIVGMDGEGPSAGDPFEIGALLASTDAVALDVVATRLVGMAPQSVYPIQAAIARGLSTGDVADVDIVGASLSDFAIHGFRVPETRGELSVGGLFNILASVMKNQMVAAPRSNDKCIGCGICTRSCPVQAITIVKKRAQMDLKTCIRCYCCHEMCPEHAIDLVKPWLGRILR